MSPRLSEREFHSLYCPVKHTKSALFLVAFFSLETYLGWKDLHKPFPRLDITELLFALVVVVLLARWLVFFTCFRDRLVLGIPLVSLAASEICKSLPGIMAPYNPFVRHVKLGLSILGLFVSLTMLIRSSRTPHTLPNERQASIARQMKRTVLISLAVVAAMLVLGSLLYFFPSAMAPH